MYKLPVIDLSKLEALLYQESSVIAESDVPRIMLVVCNEADPNGPEGADWLDKFREELTQQITPPPE
jgi:hypothetical protein